MLLKMNQNTFTFKGVMYRVKTYSWGSITFKSIYFPEISNEWLLQVYITIVFIEHLEEHDKHILNFTH